MNAVKEFQGQFRFLSNFWPAKIDLTVGQPGKVIDYGLYRWASEPHDITEMRFWPSVEHAYQAAKFIKLADAKKVLSCETPGAAKRMCRGAQIADAKLKLMVMEDLVWRKFSQNPDLGAKLVSTGSATLEEGNTWRDTFWGVDMLSGLGSNHLGKILMSVRARLTGTS